MKTIDQIKEKIVELKELKRIYNLREPEIIISTLLWVLTDTKDYKIYPDETRYFNTFYRFIRMGEDYSLNDLMTASDEELLGIPGCGKNALDWFKANKDRFYGYATLKRGYYEDT